MNGYIEKKKTIGLVLEEASGDFSKSIIHSVAHEMLNRNDLRLIHIAGRQDDCVDPEDKFHKYKNIYKLNYCINAEVHFEGLIFNLPNQTKEMEELFADIPKVFYCYQYKRQNNCQL
ncbi:MAG: hypothetical protein K6B68_12445 [Eubacterium sp.]|nr:hypothetical protein [Eubacterium sp.]